MTELPACPGPDVLESLLDGTAWVTERGAIEAHLGWCSTCQAALETVSRRSSDWRTWDRLLAGMPGTGRTTARGFGPSDATPLLRQQFAPNIPQLPDLLVPGFQLLNELGRGGMGVVYKARELSLNRLVALKVLLPQYSNQPEYLQRLRAEARAVAQLHHPNIVQIHAVGDHDGVPFLAFEYVEGASLKEVLRDGPWSARAAAKLVATVARAVHIAHAAGIVHRDLKPGNILLILPSAEDAKPKVADFGLAKHLNGSGDLTRTGMIAGTPGYMAPEQVSGRVGSITFATDVFALGAVLYELLVGRPPVRASDSADALRQTLEDDPVPPVVLQPKLPRDLNTITLKCLAKHPACRYPTAIELANDLDRFLRNEPILARPATPAEQFLKWARRRPAAATAALVGSAGVVMLLGVWLQFTAELRAEQLRTEQRRVEAEHNYRLALRAMSDLVELSEDPDFSSNGMEPLQRRLLDKARSYFAHFRDERVDHPDRLVVQGEALVLLGKIDSRLNPSSDTVAVFDQAIGVYRRLLAAQPDSPSHRYGLVTALTEKGGLLRLISRTADSRVALKDALAESEILVQFEPEALKYGKAYARISALLGWTDLTDNQLNAAVVHYQRAITKATELTGRSPDDARLWSLVGMAQYQLAMCQRRVNQRSEAFALLQTSLESRRRALELAPTSSSLRIAVAISLNGVGRSLVSMGRAKEAIDMYQKARDLSETVVQRHPAVLSYANHLAFSYCGLGNAYLAINELPAAEAAVRRALELAEPVTESQSDLTQYVEDYLKFLSSFRSVLKAQSKRVELEAAYRKTIQVYDGLVSRPYTAVRVRSLQAYVLSSYALFLAEEDRLPEAVAVSGRAAAILSEYLSGDGRDDRRAATVLKELRLRRAKAFETLGRTTEAENERQLSDRIQRGLGK